MAKSLLAEVTGAAAHTAETRAATNNTNNDNETSQRVCELLDEVARKDSALEQFRSLFETMSKDYEVAQRRAERAQLELETLVTKHEVQKQELLALKAKSALQESKIKSEDDEWGRRTRQLRQEFEAVVEERDAVVREREAQWQQVRALRLQLEEQRRKQSEAESSWACKVEETRKMTEEKARADLRERDDLLRAREAALQSGMAQLEFRLADAIADTKRLQLTNEGLEARIEDLLRCLRRQEEMTQQLQDAHGVAQMEKAQLGESIALERQAYRKRLEHTENSFKAQILELERLCEQLEHEREQLRSSAARAQREMQQDLQRARETWLQQQHQLESTIESMRGDLTRERMRFDKAEESRQRAEALLASTRRELEASQQQEATLREAIVRQQKTDAKRVVTQERLESDITRLLATIAEREREAEWWRSEVDRMEWRARFETARNERHVVNGTSHAAFQTLPPPPPPPPPLPLSASLAASRNKTRRKSLATPHRQVENAESIDCTSPVGSPFVIGANQTLSAAEENDVELLRTIVQEVLQECMTQKEPSHSLTHTSNPAIGTPTAAAAAAFTAVSASQNKRGSGRRTTSFWMQGSGPLPSTNSGDGLPCAAAKAAPPNAAGPLPSTTAFSDSSVLQARAPLFTSTANDSSFGSSCTALQPRQCVNGSKNHKEGDALPPTEGASLELLSVKREPDISAAAEVLKRHAGEREEAERQMRQTLRGLERRQQQILSTIAGGAVLMDGYVNLAETDEVRGSGESTPDKYRAFSAAATFSSSSSTSNASLPPSLSSARASTATPAAPSSRLLALQERFATMPLVQ